MFSYVDCVAVERHTKQRVVVSTVCPPFYRLSFECGAEQKRVFRDFEVCSLTFKETVTLFEFLTKQTSCLNSQF